MPPPSKIAFSRQHLCRRPGPQLGSEGKIQMAGKILICALRAICGSPPEFLRLLSRPGFRGLSGPQAASFEGGWIPLWSWCCRSCTANDIFPDLPADTPAWEPEIEAPASMQLALRDSSRSAAARCIPSQVRHEASLRGATRWRSRSALFARLPFALRGHKTGI